ncbi:SDR family oxidoreductase [Streptomyces sp. NBC_00249]|uniref:SDR family oxidoreductase n=1 Tax=Streptomyces sp. NBC_00249 TaxID=2975690 RepID=UPI0022564BB6|nr:SDR family oxidoreductase [Streptomyces sp. NBC_00249]MCX5197378.1 SDR family oxidoreductase [Streptomyces sp. NBC_00249]
MTNDHTTGRDRPRGTGAAADLTGKVALVTGGARNVGKAVATTLAERGAHVLINYFHSHEQAKRTRDELRALGATVDIFRASVARPEQVTRMFAEIEQKIGRLDILVNNAADGALVPVDETTDADIDRALETNLKGGLRCARAAAPLMARSGGGSIVTVSALGASQMVMANYLACAPAKAAAEAAARYLAVEFAPQNIRVNIASAAMLTSEVADKFPDAAAMQQAVIDGTPLGRLGTAQEFARLVAFLASDESSWITGQVILADGGLTLGSTLLAPARAGQAMTPVMTPVTTPPAADSVAAAPEPQAQPQPALRTEPGGVLKAVRDVDAPGAESAAEPEPATEAAPAPAPEPAPEPAAAAAAAAPDEVDDADDEIAVVGMGLAVSGANSPAELWQLRTTGAELFIEVPEDRWERAAFSSPDQADEDKSYQDTCVFITDFRPEPTALEGLSASPDDTELTTLWLRHSLVQALDGVHRDPADRHSFHVGYTADGSQHLEEAGVLAASNHLIGEITTELDLAGPERDRLLSGVDRALSARYHRGQADAPRFLPHQVGQEAMAGVLPADTPVQMVDTACSSSLYAIDIGVKGLLSGQYDIAVAGGAFALAPRGTVLFSKLKGLSKRGSVQSLDAEADGVIFADGAGVVVLKRLSRAKADGDRILGVLRAFGSSSDGKGKAIYAPSSAGQDLAVRRALTAGGLTGADVDWVNAHATGTPAGDLAEFTTLRGHYGQDRAAVVTSNKSLIGHTGWAAGVVSLIESILAIQEQTIPGQYRYRSAPELFEMGSTKLEISSESRPWEPREGSRRTAAVSGFGFGGTNAHLIVSEQAGNAERTEPAKGATRVQAAPAERIAVVGWSAKLPGTSGRQDVQEWLDGARTIDAGFGDTYPAPSFQEVRMPPATVRTIDRCQLMIISCAHELRGQLSEFWDAKAERTGVVVGHMGPTRAAMLYANRCYLDDIERGLRADPSLAAEPGLTAVVDRLRERVRSMTPPSNEDSFPGMMPNVISARVANYFDLHGPNITVDAGLGSALSAFSTAARYLHSGELDFVLAGGINGNSLPEYRPLLGEVFGGRTVEPAEGAFLFGLTTESKAREAGLEVLAFVDELTPGARPAEEATELECGAEGEYSRYLGAAGGLALLRALQRPGAPTVIRCRESAADVAPGLVVTAPGQPAAASTETPEHTAARPPQLVHRYATTLRPEPAHTASAGSAAATSARTAADFLPAGAVVLTDDPELVARIAPPAAAITVLSTARPAAPRPGWHHLPEVTPDAVREVLASLPGPVRDLRVVADLTASVPAEEALTGAAEGITALHDLTFLAVQQRYEDLGAAMSSVVFLLLGAMPGGIAHPLAGLFTGLAKCVSLELADADSYAFLAATSDPQAGARLAALEADAVRTFPVVYHDGTRRLVPALQEAPAPQDPAGPGPAPLGRDSVVLALGGARGITAELLTALAERYGSRIYALGSNALDTYPPETFEGSDEEFAATRSAYISARLRAGGGTVADISRQFDRMSDARTARRNLDRMARHSGEGRVSYLTCDARDEASVRAAVDAVVAEHGRIDLVINAPGLNRSAMIRDKDFGEFRRIRDLKVAAHRNLHRALAGRAPRMWCDFGSLLGFFGQRGESDYASGNDYLATAAGYAAATTGTAEFVIGWTLWDEVGMGANELTRAYFKRAGSYSHMPVEEGVRHFLAELAAPRGTASVVHLGEAERATVEQFYPGYLDARPASGPQRGRFYLRRELPQPPADTARADGATAVFECAFDLDSDGYLEHHLVRGVPTLPGTFVTELASEAALHLVPEGVVVALEDVRFHHFLQVHREIPQGPKRITATVAGQVGDLTTVEVEVSYDVVSPTGVKLVSGRPHFTARVLVSNAFPDAPLWQPWEDSEDVPVPDPYHADGAPVRLTGPFMATTGTRSGPRGARSVFRAELDPAEPAWSSFLVPTVLLDAMARTGVLAPVDGLIPVAAPLSIRRVDLYQQANDRELTAQHGELDLYVVNPGFVEGRPEGNRFVAVAPGGRVVAQMKDLTATVIGYLDPATGVVHGPGALAEAVSS